MCFSAVFRKLAVVGILFSSFEPAAIHAQIDRATELKVQYGNSRVYGEVRDFGMWTIAGSVRRELSTHISLEPEFTYTHGSPLVAGIRDKQTSRNGLFKISLDLTGPRKAVPYVSTGFGVHSSGGDTGLTALAALGTRIELQNRFFISPEIRIAFPFLENPMPGLLVGFGYRF
jgi:hypothetical protein